MARADAECRRRADARRMKDRESGSHRHRAHGKIETGDVRCPSVLPLPISLGPEPFGAPAIAADIAYRTGTLARALAWYRYARGVSPEEIDPDDAESVPYGLRLYLENGPVGTWA